MDPTRPEITVLIVTYNCREAVVRALDSVGAFPPSVPYEVLLVDNASSDGTVAAVRARFPKVTVVELPENVGYGSAMNILAERARGRYFVFLNPDTVLTESSFDSLYAFAEAHGRLGVLSPRLVYADGRPQPSARRFPSPARLWFEVLRLHLLLPSPRRAKLLGGTYFAQDVTQEVDWTSGACHFIPRSHLGDGRAADRGDLLRVRRPRVLHADSCGGTDELVLRRHRDHASLRCERQRPVEAEPGHRPGHQQHVRGASPPLGRSPAQELLRRGGLRCAHRGRIEWTPNVVRRVRYGGHTAMKRSTGCGFSRCCSSRSGSRCGAASRRASSQQLVRGATDPPASHRCPLCGGDLGRSRMRPVLFAGHEFRYQRCRACRSLVCDPMPDDAVLNVLYGPEYGSVEPDHYDVDSPRDTAAVLAFLNDRPPGRFLDFGCGPGDLLSEVQAQTKWEPLGVELDPAVAAAAQARTGAQVLTYASLLSTAIEPVQAVHMGDVVEHLTDLDHQMGVVLSVLATGGHLLAEGPLQGGPTLFEASIQLAQALRSTSPVHAPPHHVLQATAGGQRKFFNRHGLKESVYTVYEVDWPAPSRLRRNDLSDARTVALFALRQLSRRVSHALSWGNRYRYVGRLGPVTLSTKVRSKQARSTRPSWRVHS